MVKRRMLPTPCSLAAVPYHDKAEIKQQPWVLLWVTLKQHHWSWDWVPEGEGKGEGAALFLAALPGHRDGVWKSALITTTSCSRIGCWVNENSPVTFLPLLSHYHTSIPSPDLASLPSCKAAIKKIVSYSQRQRE